jgi:hypothetical protein
MRAVSSAGLPFLTRQPELEPEPEPEPALHAAPALPSGSWACESCMSVGNVAARCAVCSAWRSEAHQQAALEEEQQQQAAAALAEEEQGRRVQQQAPQQAQPQSSQVEPDGWPDQGPLPEREREPQGEPPLSVGGLCRVLPEAAVETALALLTEQRGQPAPSLSDAQRSCCGRVGVAVHVDERERTCKLQFTGGLGSHIFPCEAITVDTSADTERISAELVEQRRAEMQRRTEEARQLAEERRQQLADVKDLTAELLSAALERAMLRLAERRRLDGAATCVAAHYRGYAARKLRPALVAERREAHERAARAAEVENAADDMSALLAVIGELEQKDRGGKLGWSADAGGDKSLRAAAAGIDPRVRPGGAVSHVQLGPLWVEGTAPHNRLVTALLDEAVRSGGGRILFRAPRSGVLDLSGGGAAAWGGLRMPRGPRQMQLTSLDLSGAQLHDSGAAGLASGIFGSSGSAEGVCALRDIRLADCGLGPRGVASIAACLEACPSLRLLDLRGNSAGVDGGHALAAAVSQPRSMLSVLVFNLNTAVAAGSQNLPAAPLVPWSRESYQSVVHAFTEALPASALSHLDIGYASTGRDGLLLNCLRTAALPKTWVAAERPSRDSKRRRDRKSIASSSGGSFGASSGSLWLGLPADSFHESIAVPLESHPRRATLAARQRLAWAVCALHGAYMLTRTALAPQVAECVAIHMGRPMVPLSELGGDLRAARLGLDIASCGSHYRCCLPAAVRQGADMDSPLLGRSLQVGEVIAGLELVTPPGGAARLRFRIPSPPLIGMTAWVSLRAADGRDVLRPLEARGSSGNTLSESKAMAVLDSAASGVQQVCAPIEGDRREAVDARRRAALSSAAARHLAAMLLRQRSEQSHAARAEFLIVFVADPFEVASPRRRQRKRPGSAGGLDSAHLVDGVTRQLKKASRWLIVTSADVIQDGLPCKDGLRMRVRVHDAKRVHRRGDQVSLRVSKDRVIKAPADNRDNGGDDPSTDDDESGEDDDGTVQWETVVECGPDTEWLSQVAAVASRLLLPDCPLADKIGTGWACLRSLFLHKERQDQAAKLLRTTIAESQDALAKLGVGGQARQYRASLEERRQASIRNSTLQRRRPTSATAAAATGKAETRPGAATAERLKAAPTAAVVPHPLARAEDMLQYAMDMLDAADQTAAGGLWQVAHKHGAKLLAEPRLDAEEVCALPQGAMVEVLQKQPVQVELPPERVIRQPPSKSELTVRRHASLLRTTRGWVVERLPANDAVVLASIPWESLGGGRGGGDVLRTLRRKEVGRLTAVVDERRVAATKVERWWRRHIVSSRTAIRRVAVAEVKAVEGMISVSLSRPLALAPTIALHLEDQAHVLDRGLVQEVQLDTKKAVRFVRPGSAAAAAAAAGHRTPRQTAGLLRQHGGVAQRAPGPRSSFATELHAHVAAAAAVWSRGGEAAPAAAATGAIGDSLGWLQGSGGALSASYDDDPALGLAMATEIAGLTRAPSSPAMAAALRADLATRRHPPRAMRAHLARLEAGALATTRAANTQAMQERQSLSIFRAPREEPKGWSSETARRRRRQKAQEAQAAELRRLTGEMDLKLEKDVVKRATRLSRSATAAGAEVVL